MKKCLIILLLAMILCVLGCNKQYVEVDYSDKPLPYSVLLYDYTDSATSVNKTKEYEFADREKYDHIKGDKTKKITISGETVKGGFFKKSYRGCNYFPEFEYYDENVSFMTDENEKLTSYYRFGKIDTDRKITMKEAVDSAEAFLKDVINVSDYSMESEFEENKNQYVITYRKYVGNIKTAEYAEVVVDCGGNVKSFSSEMLGRISDVTADDIDFDKIGNKVKSKTDELYKDVIASFDKIEYSEPDYKLTVLKDGSRAVLCKLDVEFISYYQVNEIVISERLLMVIPVE